ncbi:MAG: hypothetical protein DMG32_25385 [Acidobacteria bacterium]|nr:MAG: hypothetical protein DMG32_25385 [Acidobacteriota bacterium]
MATDSEKVCASDENFFEFLSSEAACVSRTACFLLRTKRRKRLMVLCWAMSSPEGFVPLGAAF